jgi:hypothetical protein
MINDDPMDDLLKELVNVKRNLDSLMDEAIHKRKEQRLQAALRIFCAYEMTDPDATVKTKITWAIQAADELLATLETCERKEQ